VAVSFRKKEMSLHKFKDHQIARLVNDLKALTLKYKDMQMLREMIPGKEGCEMQPWLLRHQPVFGQI
jgi:hypothetical protein